MATAQTKQEIKPKMNSSRTSKYPVPKYKVLTFECGGSVIVQEIEKAQASASDTGFMPSCEASAMTAGIKMVVRTVLLVKIKWLNTEMKIKEMATNSWLILSSPTASISRLIAQEAPPESLSA